VSFGDDLAAALPELRALAESLMLDSCIVTGPGADPVWNDETGTYDAPEGGTVYAGRCQLAKGAPAGQDVDSGEASWVTGAVVLKLPMAAGPDDEGDPLAVATGHSVVVTSRAGLAMSVRMALPQTFEKSRKVACEVVTRDA